VICGRFIVDLYSIFVVIAGRSISDEKAEKKMI